MVECKIERILDFQGLNILESILLWVLILKDFIALSCSAGAKECTKLEICCKVHFFLRLQFLLFSWRDSLVFYVLSSPITSSRVYHNSWFLNCWGTCAKFIVNHFSVVKFSNVQEIFRIILPIFNPNEVELNSSLKRCKKHRSDSQKYHEVPFQRLPWKSVKQ